MNDTHALQTKKEIDKALAQAETRMIIIRGLTKLWHNLRDPRLSTQAKTIFGLGTSLSWLIYVLSPIDFLPDALIPLLIPFLGPLAFFLLLDDAFLVPILGIWLFNKWADSKRRQQT